jgi:hypothetical protein
MKVAAFIVVALVETHKIVCEATFCQIQEKKKRDNLVQLFPRIAGTIFYTDFGDLIAKMAYPSGKSLFWL